MLSAVTDFLKLYNKKLYTVATFIVVWTCVLLIFNNQISLDILNETMQAYPEDKFFEKVANVEMHQKEKLVWAQSICFGKILIFILGFFK